MGMGNPLPNPILRIDSNVKICLKIPPLAYNFIHMYRTGIDQMQICNPTINYFYHI